MINAIFKGILSACNQLINLVCLPVDLAITQFFPDFSSQIQDAVYHIILFLDNLSYAGGWIPPSFVNVLFLIFSTQITFIALNKTVGSITKIYTVIRKIKFW